MASPMYFLFCRIFFRVAVWFWKPPLPLSPARYPSYPKDASFRNTEIFPVLWGESKDKKSRAETCLLTSLGSRKSLVFYTLSIRLYPTRLFANAWQQTHHLTMAREDRKYVICRTVRPTWSTAVFLSENVAGNISSPIHMIYPTHVKTSLFPSTHKWFSLWKLVKIKVV